MNAKTVRKVINREGAVFENCWEILSRMAAGEPDDAFFELQAVLGESLLRLEQLYQPIASERRRLIQRKAHVSPRWFRRRQRALAGHQQVIRSAMYNGRAIGDAFVWYFYQSSAALLGEHLAWPETEFPTGEGGKGEVGFAKNFRVLDGHFVLYHSITSILRIGDFSLVNLNERKVAALGEIKSQRIGPQEYRANVSLIGASAEGFSPPKSRPVAHRSDGTITELLPKWIRQRLKKQVAAMGKALGAEKAPDFQRNQVHKGLAKQLGNLANSARVGTPAISVIDPCVLATVVKFRKRTLYSRLTTAWSEDGSLAAVPRLALKIVVPGSQWNSIHISTLLYDEKGKPSLMRGGLPLFWSKLPRDVAKRLYFQDLVALIAFNPARILHKLEERGWVLEQTGNHPFDIGAILRRENRECRLEGLPYFFNLMLGALWSSDELLRMIDDFAEESFAQPPGPGRTRVVLDLRMRAGTFNGDPD